MATFSNAALVTEHSQQGHCIRPDHIFKPHKEGPYGLCDKSQDAIFKSRMREALGDLKSNQGLDNRVLLPTQPLLPSSSSKFQGCLLTNTTQRQQDGALGCPGHKKAPPGNRLQVSSWPGLCGRGWERLWGLRPAPTLISLASPEHF